MSKPLTIPCPVCQGKGCWLCQKTGFIEGDDGSDDDDDNDDDDDDDDKTNFHNATR